MRYASSGPRNAVFDAIADPTRRAILDRLRRKRLAAGELARGFTISRPAISRHVRVLRQAGLVREQRSGRNRVYEITPAPLAEVDRWIGEYRLFWTRQLKSLKRFVESGGDNG
jgi:DNA-binding transcriptional ArsR family regulator